MSYSDHTNKELLSKPSYIQRYIGGKKNPEDNSRYISNQLRLIKAGNQELPPNVRYNPNGKMQSQLKLIPEKKNILDINLPPTKPLQYGISQESNTKLNRENNDIYMRGLKDKYDPYEGYLFSRGLMDDGTNKRRYRTDYINIDSIFRVKQPSLDVDDPFVLSENPLDFNINSRIVFINHKNNSYEVGDLITLENVFGNQLVLQTFDDNGTATFEIPAGCNFMKINIPHGLPFDYDDDIIQIELNGIRGDRGNMDNASFLGNIPINIFNTKHSIKLTLTQVDLDPDCNINNFPDGYFDVNLNYFFIILPVSMQNPQNAAPYVLRTYNFKIIFLSIGGIPLNLLNARYPIDPNNRQGFHIIRSVSQNGYMIELPINAILDENGGGKCVTVAKINSVNTGYPNPNDYIIELGATFHDVISVRLVSMEFPNSDTAIRDYPPERANNKIYWNDIDDGNFLYSIEIPSGNYAPNDLVTIMETLFLATVRVNAGILGFNYSPNHFIKVGINMNTNEVTFESFKEFILSQPIINVEPAISLDPEIVPDDPDAEYELTIFHPNHGLTEIGSIILISNAISHFGIPTDILNAEHIVIEIIDNDTYKIKLPKLNLGIVRTDTKGGAAVTILVPDLFRLRFDQPDTMASILGFRNPGDPNSIFAFSNIISNKDEYEFDIEENALGESIIIKNNAIQLSGDNYVLMIAEPLETLSSIGSIKRAFAKIQLCDIPGKVLFNTHVNTSRFYVDSLHEVSELKVQFYTPDGFLYDFNGLDHSYTIEFVTVNDIPEGSGLSANTGKNYNLDS